MLLCYFKFLCLVDLTLTHYVLWPKAKDFLSVEQITECKILATCGVGNNIHECVLGSVGMVLTIVNCTTQRGGGGNCFGATVCAKIPH